MIQYGILQLEYLRSALHFLHFFILHTHPQMLSWFTNKRVTCMKTKMLLTRKVLVCVFEAFSVKHLWRLSERLLFLPRNANISWANASASVRSHLKVAVAVTKIGGNNHWEPFSSFLLGQTRHIVLWVGWICYGI